MDCLVFVDERPFGELMGCEPDYVMGAFSDLAAIIYS